MGFYIDPRSLDLKQHLNLTEYAWFVLQSDIEAFEDIASPSFSGFLNRVFNNFYQDSRASISIRCQVKKKELVNLFSGPEFDSIDSKTKSIFTERMLGAYRDELVKWAFSSPKGPNPRKFRINQQNVQILKNDLQEESNYGDSIGCYMKALFEEYARLPRWQREAIYFKQTIDVAKEAIGDGNNLKISQREKSTVDEKRLYVNQFYFAPYKIVQDTTGSFNYLLGYSQRIFKNADGKVFVTEPSESTLRIDRISSIREIKGMGPTLFKKDKEKLDSDLLMRTAAFMAKDTIQIVVKFTKKGLEQLRNQIYMRPQGIEFSTPEPDGSMVVHFQCSDIQAMNYLFKMGHLVEILEPASLREKFLDRYKQAVLVYEKDDQGK
jgi:hypothetical protein